MEDHTFLFKIVLIGNSGVGKTCLAQSFIRGQFPTDKGATLGVDFMIKPMVVNGIRVKLQLWDTAGQERFRAITQSYYRSAHCLVLVYDVSSQPSFDSLKQWCRDMEQYTTSSIDGSSNVLRVLVGNKCDKDSEVPDYVCQSFASSRNFDFFMETSALHLNNVNRLFEEIAQRLTDTKLKTMSIEKQQQQQQNAKHEDNQDGNGTTNHRGGDVGKSISNSIDSWRQAINLHQTTQTLTNKMRSSCCSSS